MKCRVQIITETEAGDQVQEIACLERNTARLEDVGLTLAETRCLLAGVQKAVVQQQIAEYSAAHRCCPHCGQVLLHKGSHQMTFRTLFGNLEVQSPRLFHCRCQAHQTRTFSPLTELLPEHTAPERLYLETKWGSLISFELAAKLLGEVLPIEKQINASSVRRHLHGIAQRSEASLGEEQFSFIDGCPREWKQCPGRRPRW